MIMGGFHIPAALLDREAAGLDLIMHARSLWGVVADAPMSMAQVKLADWLMADPVALTDMIADAGVDLGAVLAGTPPQPRQALTIYNMTGGLIRLGDWARGHGGGAGAPAVDAGDMPADGAPIVSIDSGVTDARFWVSRDDVAVRSIAGGVTFGPATLGQVEPGPLFRCDADAEGKTFLLAGLSCTWRLDRASATAAATALADALGMTLIPAVPVERGER